MAVEGKGEERNAGVKNEVKTVDRRGAGCKQPEGIPKVNEKKEFR